jgi:hypothetical protein
VPHINTFLNFVAGRPKSRARREAEAGKVAAPSFADALARQLIAPIPDREYLSQWWALEFASIERTLEERRNLLADAGPHPSAMIAREVLAAGVRGIPKDALAVLLQMSETELELHYGVEYASGCAEVIARAAQNMMRIAVSTNDRVAVKALSDFLNRRGGEEWRAPAQKLEIDDSKKAKGNLIDSSKMTWEDRQLLRGILERTVGRRVDGEIVGGVVPQIQSEKGEEA